MANKHRSVCPQNCFDTCSLIVEEEKGIITKVSGESEHPWTKGFVCRKGNKLIQRMYSPDRIKYPLKRVGNKWQRITWDEALSTIAEKLHQIKQEFGTTAVLHLYDSGSNGFLRNLDRRFFNAYGGVTGPVGSLCWGSGYAAQLYDFGGMAAHSWDDLTNAKTIILWGRDPMSTNVHLLPFLKSAREQGAKLVAVSPIRTKTAKMADLHIAPKPGTDGALALAMAYVILSERLLDLEFVAKHTFGFEEYARLVKTWTPERAALVTGISAEDIENFARLYAKNKPGAILFGYGMQRYANGGQTVRAIDALAAITGNIGVPGGGANYAHSYWSEVLHDIGGDELAQVTREFPWPKLAEEILQAEDPPVKALFVTRCNPVSQLPNTTKVLTAFRQIDFKVVIDMVLTDTAREADLVLPCTTIFEEEDMVASSWNFYLGYGRQIVTPPAEVRSELEIFTELAERLGLAEFPRLTAAQWLERVLAPKGQISLAALSEKSLRHPTAPDVAWQTKEFKTPSGKFEFYSQLAERDGVRPLPEFVPHRENLGAPALSQDYPLQLITPHRADQTHSQFFNLEMDEVSSLPIVEIHPAVAADRFLDENNEVLVESERGTIKALVRINTDVPPEIALISEGWWHVEAPGVNFLTGDFVPDMGLGVPYYDCRCQIRKVL